MIPISRPFIGPEEKAAVERVLESGMLAQGARVSEFEAEFAAYIGVKHAVATSNGTTALHTALLAHGIGPGDEVITTPFTFIASINAILYTGATPVLVDIDESYNIDPELVRRVITPHTRAIMPVHLYGQPADLALLGEIVREHNLVLVEDACQAHGATFDERRVGSFGTAGFSFYATKNMTTGEGGMLTTNDDSVAERARLLINHGMRVRYHHETLGYNFRMTDIGGALGSEQLRRLPAFNARRSETAEIYNACLGSIPGLVTPTVSTRRTHAWHQYTLRVTPPFPFSRDQLVDRLREAGIGSMIYYPIPAHRQKALRGLAVADSHLPLAEQYATQVISIPVHPNVSDEEREHIVRTLEKLAGR